MSERILRIVITLLIAAGGIMLSTASAIAHNHVSSWLIAGGMSAFILVLIVLPVYWRAR